MKADPLYQDVLEGVIAKLNDSNASYGIRSATVENLRQVFWVLTC